jgi:hypothetical protein
VLHVKIVDDESPARGSAPIKSSTKPVPLPPPCPTPEPGRQLRRAYPEPKLGSSTRSFVPSPAMPRAEELGDLGGLLEHGVLARLARVPRITDRKYFVAH